MELGAFFKSIIDQDDEPIVICDMMDTIVYMNPSAMEMYSDESGGNLIGRSIMDCHPPQANRRIKEVAEWFMRSCDNNSVHTLYMELRNVDVYMVALRSDDGELIGYYEKHVTRNRDPTPFYRM